MNAATAAGSKTTKGPPVSDQPTVEVRGKALYLEFHNTSLGRTFQLLIHPDGTSSSGAHVPFGLFYRTLSTSYPKRPWKKTGVSTAIVKREVDPVTLRLAPVTDTARLMDIVGSYEKQASDILSQLVRQQYTLFKQPVVVEVSSVDFDELANGNTPYALFRRVMSARKTIGFPDDLVISTK